MQRGKSKQELIECRTSSISTCEFQFKDVQDAAQHIRGEVVETPLEVCAMIASFLLYVNVKLCPATNTEIQAALRNAKDEYLLKERLSHGRRQEVGILIVITPPSRCWCTVIILRHYWCVLFFYKLLIMRHILMSARI